jgi:hypothetical protein
MQKFKNNAVLPALRILIDRARRTLVLGPLILFAAEASAVAQCNPDPSTSRPAGIPAGLQTAISTIDAQLDGVQPIGSLTITFSTSISPTVNIIEQDCKDSENCNCGVYGTGTFSLNYNTSASTTLSQTSFGPYSASAWDHTLTVSGLAAGNLACNQTNSGGGTVSRGCADNDWTYSGGGNYNASVTLSGTATGQATITTPDENGQQQQVFSDSVSGALSGTFSYNLASNINVGSSNGTISSGGSSASVGFTFPIFGSTGFAFSF